MQFRKPSKYPQIFCKKSNMVESCKDQITKDGYKQQWVAGFLSFAFGFSLIEKCVSCGLSFKFYLHNSEGLKYTQISLIWIETNVYR